MGLLNESRIPYLSKIPYSSSQPVSATWEFAGNIRPVFSPAEHLPGKGFESRVRVYIFPGTCAGIASVASIFLGICVLQILRDLPVRTLALRLSTMDQRVRRSLQGSQQDDLTFLSLDLTQRVSQGFPNNLFPAVVEEISRSWFFTIEEAQQAMRQIRSNGQFTDDQVNQLFNLMSTRIYRPICTCRIYLVPGCQ